MDRVVGLYKSLADCQNTGACLLYTSYYSNIPYNITPVNCTVDKTEAAKGDTVTATRRALKANERFTGWTVKVNGVEQDTDTFLKPDANDPAKVSFVMPAENVEIKANFASNPTPVSYTHLRYDGD